MLSLAQKTSTPTASSSFCRADPAIGSSATRRARFFPGWGKRSGGFIGDGSGQTACARGESRQQTRDSVQLRRCNVKSLNRSRCKDQVLNGRCEEQVLAVERRGGSALLLRKGSESEVLSGR